MDEAERCHRLAYLAYGNMLTKGTIDDIILHEGLTTWIVKGKNLLGLAMELKKYPVVEQVLAFGNVMHLSGKDETGLRKVVEKFDSADYSWSKADTSIEDVFIHLMKKAKDNF